MYILVLDNLLDKFIISIEKKSGNEKRRGKEREAEKETEFNISN